MQGIKILIGIQKIGKILVGTMKNVKNPKNRKILQGINSPAEDKDIVKKIYLISKILEII